MNPDLIETRDAALALVEADLITIQDYRALCRFKGWNPSGPAPARVLTERAVRPAPVPEVASRETLAPARGQILRFSLRNA